ncbi:hypothetical protein HAX54_020427, partial [Datura stramonium]|nr:hypothetical protein [Datura stramonium]
HGGKILPQPADGHLKYVGGETRVISVPRNIKLSELMKKLTPQIEGDMVLKYQLVHEDLDALISVKTDEDLRHMDPEASCLPLPSKARGGGPPRDATEPLEQQTIHRAINGIIRAREAGLRIQPPLSIGHASFGFSSACSSPSPDSCTTDELFIHESLLQSIFKIEANCTSSRVPLTFTMSLTSSSSNIGYHNHQHHYYNYRQPNYNGYQLNKPPPGDQSRARQKYSRGSGCCTKCMHYDDYGHYGERRNGSISRTDYSMEIGIGCPSPVLFCGKKNQ